MIIPHLEPIGQDGGEKVAQTGKMAHMYPPSPGEWWGCTMANCVWAQDRPPLAKANARQRVVLPARVVKPPATSNGTVTQLADGARQLVLDVFVCPSNSEKRKVRALIDTGAQINVILRGLFPE